MNTEIDPEYLKEVMEICKRECPEIADHDYLVWVNSVDYILRERGIENGKEQAIEDYERAKKEFEKDTYTFEILPPEPEVH
jgi:hypothetical protein